MQDLKTIPNGTPVGARTFSEGEFARRLAGLRGVMEEEGMDGVLFTSVHNINYYCDFLYCAFGRRYGLWVDGERVVVISANIDGGRRRS